MSAPTLSWDIGTAYDFFVSLDVLHDPSRYGVRGVWAAGMRSRLPAAEREFFEQVMGKVLMGPPLGWLYALPAPKTCSAVLDALGKMPTADILPAFALGGSDRHAEMRDILLNVAAKGAWDDADADAYRAAYVDMRGGKPSRKDLAALLDWWAQPAAFGEMLGRALRAYYEAFFAEEERRIAPALESALDAAQKLADRLAVPDLLEELSQGLSFGPALDKSGLVLAPSYWSSPLVYFHDLAPDRMLILFGGRPADASLIPGEMVPDALVRALKALSDPTRLKIMYYLASESLTPTQLSHRLRLRAPTVVHHLQTLRVAGLVQVTIAEGKERSYALRTGTVLTTVEGLQAFLGIDARAEDETRVRVRQK